MSISSSWQFALRQMGRRGFLQNSSCMALTTLIGTDHRYVIEVNGFKFGMPKYKLGDRVKYQWHQSIEDSRFNTIGYKTIYQEGIVIGYQPNCNPETYHEEKFIGRWGYLINWLTCSLPGDHNIGIDLHCVYYESELTLAD